MAVTVIDGGGWGEVVQFKEGDTSLLKGFNIQNRNYRGIYIYKSSPTIENNDIVANNNKGGYGGGISVSWGSPTITANTISNNEALYLSVGIYIQNSNAVITANIISSNEAGSGGGIHLSESSIIIAENTISNNEAKYNGGGIYVSLGSYLLPVTIRPTGWGSAGDSDYRQNVSPDDSPIANNNFSGNTHGGDPADGAQVYFERL